LQFWGFLAYKKHYKAILVEADAYATELSRYIHLNPVRAGMVRSPEEYRWSSYSYYTERCAPSWLKTEFILGYFDTDTTQSRKDGKAVGSDLHN